MGSLASLLRAGAAALPRSRPSQGTSVGRDGPDQDSVFRDAVRGVRPLARRPVAHPQARKGINNFAAKRAAAAGLPVEGSDRNPLTLGAQVQVGPDEVLSWRGAGVQHRAFRRLRSGSLAIEAVLDLHGRTVAEAHGDIFRFIAGAVGGPGSCVLIVHGRGARAQTSAKLKSCVNAWLPQHPRVLAFHSAKPADGGAGAVYVLIRSA